VHRKDPVAHRKSGEGEVGGITSALEMRDLERGTKGSRRSREKETGRRGGTEGAEGYPPEGACKIKQEELSA